MKVSPNATQVAKVRLIVLSSTVIALAAGVHTTGSSLGSQYVWTHLLWTGCVNALPVSWFIGIESIGCTLAATPVTFTL
jgi:hypothetical protein